MPDSLAHFQKHFGHLPAHAVRAPGRLELLGNHTDYNAGLVLSLAVDKYIEFTVSPRADGMIELRSSAFPRSEIFPVAKIEKNPAAPWADYVKGVLDQLQRRGIPFSGFNAGIHGTIPLGAGMSSSAALLVGTALAVRQLFPYQLTESGPGPIPTRDTDGNLPSIPLTEKILLAKLCRAAEGDFVGVQVGLLDQISSLCGRFAHVMEIDFRSLVVEWAPMPGDAIIICDSGVKHALVEGGYNELRAHCEAAARLLGVTTLREASPALVRANKSRLTERQFQCAWHITTEIERVALGAEALRAKDHRQFGRYMFASHASSRDFFKNSVPELDTLVELAGLHPGCLGARLTGGGFGGATINLVTHDQATDFMAAITRQYAEKTGRQTHPIRCQVVDGAG